MSSMAVPSWWKNLPWSMQTYGSGLPMYLRG